MVEPEERVDDQVGMGCRCSDSCCSRRNLLCQSWSMSSKRCSGGMTEKMEDRDL